MKYTCAFSIVKYVVLEYFVKQKTWKVLLVGSRKTRQYYTSLNSLVLDH